MLVRASGTDVFRLAASKLIGSKSSSSTAGHPGPTCLDSGGCGRRVNRRTWATDVSSINRYLDAAATQSAPSPASLICCWSFGGTDGLLTPMFSSSLQSRRWKAWGTVLAEELMVNVAMMTAVAAMTVRRWAGVGWRPVASCECDAPRCVPDTSDGAYNARLATASHELSIWYSTPRTNALDAAACCWSICDALSSSLTLSSPAVSNGYTSECSGPYWSNQPFLIFLTFGHSGAQYWAPECPNVKKIKKGGLDQYGAQRFRRLIFATIRKSVELKGLTQIIIFSYTVITRTLSRGAFLSISGDVTHSVPSTVTTSLLHWDRGCGTSVILFSKAPRINISAYTDGHASAVWLRNFTANHS